MERTKTNNKKQLVNCMDCHHAMLHRYNNNPILAACEAQPQPYNDRFPFKVEIASYMRYCACHKHTDAQKVVQQRYKAS